MPGYVQMQNQLTLKTLYPTAIAFQNNTSVAIHLTLICSLIHCPGYLFLDLSCCVLLCAVMIVFYECVLLLTAPELPPGE